MIVVADASPINYLLLVEHIDILPALFEKVLLPSAVHEELQHSRSPQMVKLWARHLPQWCSTAAVQEAEDPLLQRLDAGERAAIQLATERAADYLLIDEQDGRKVAMERRLPIVGTLAVLERASQRGLLDFRQALGKLERTSFRLSARLRAAYILRNP